MNEIDAFGIAGIVILLVTGMNVISMLRTGSLVSSYEEQTRIFTDAMKKAVDSHKLMNELTITQMREEAERRHAAVAALAELGWTMHYDPQTRSWRREKLPFIAA